MQQHPVPQNVTSYQFRLIGDMTLKQFLQLLAGGVVAFVFYSTNLISIVKWFFMFISVIAGVAFAFLPLEGRPLDQWLMAFIRAIYMPTQFYWQKNPKLPDYLSDSPSIKSPDLIAPAPRTPPPQVVEAEPETQQLESHHSKRIEEIIKLYDEVPTNAPKPTPTTAPTITHKPSATASVKSTVTPITPITINIAKTTEKPEEVLQAAPQPQAKAPTPQVNTNQTTNGSSAIFNSSLPFPSPPQTPNTLIGMVFDRAGNIVDSAVIEIKNKTGTVRATKTNRLGQFFLATPLENDTYSIDVEKAGLTFKPISLRLENKIYPPLDIRATN